MAELEPLLAMLSDFSVRSLMRVIMRLREKFFAEKATIGCETNVDGCRIWTPHHSNERTDNKSSTVSHYLCTADQLANYYNE
jgi:hypothetical protein